MGMIGTPQDFAPNLGGGQQEGDTPDSFLGLEELDFSGIGEALANNQELIQNQKLAAQTQASDIQVNPLPSLPSISNVGAVPFTGTVSSIPGGFQPLPQVAGGRKKLYLLK